MDEKEEVSQIPVHRKRQRRFVRNGMIGLISGLVFTLACWAALAITQGNAIGEYLRSGCKILVYPCLLIGDYLIDLGLIKNENIPAIIAMVFAYFGIIGLILGLGITCFAMKTKRIHQ